MRLLSQKEITNEKDQRLEEAEKKLAHTLNLIKQGEKLLKDIKTQIEYEQEKLERLTIKWQEIQNEVWRSQQI